MFLQVMRESALTRQLMQNSSNDRSIPFLSSDYSAF